MSSTGCSGGFMRARNSAGSVTATFTGTAITVVATKGATYGVMKVTLDGVVQPSVNLYACDGRLPAEGLQRTAA